MHSFARLTLSTLLYGTATAKTLDKRSTNGNKGLSGGEIAGHVVGIVGVILTAMTVFIGWKYRKVCQNNCISVVRKIISVYTTILTVIYPS
jgi:hypothetical protein